MNEDLEFAFRLADIADSQTLHRWSSSGVGFVSKSDGTPVSEADIAAEQAMLTLVQQARPGDGFLGEEVGEHPGSTDRRWIVDGIDGTRSFVAGSRTWGTLIALEHATEIVLGLSTSPAQNRRWWAARGEGAFTSRSARHSPATQLRVAGERPLRSELIATLPDPSSLDHSHRRVLEDLAGGTPTAHPWSHQNRVAEGELDLCVWFAGDTWDHAAPSIIVEEAGGRFTDHDGGRRLDTRTAIYSNGHVHEQALSALRRLQ